MFALHRRTLKDGRDAVIRLAEPADAEALIAHVNEVGAEGVYIMTEKIEKSIEEQREFLAKIDPRWTLFFVAVLAGQLVASADVARGRQSKNAHTGSVGIAIRKEARGLGLGRAMMEDAIGWARSVGIRKLTLGVFATNERAITLYRSLGFEEEGRRKGQVLLGGQPVDEILMARWL